MSIFLLNELFLIFWFNLSKDVLGLLFILLTLVDLLFIFILTGVCELILVEGSSVLLLLLI